MIDRPRTNQAVRLPGLAALALGVALMAPAPARGQIVPPQQQCVFETGFPSACATLQSIVFSGNTMTLIVTNSSGVLDPQAFIGFLLLEFNGPPPLLASSDAPAVFGTYSGGFLPDGSVEEIWKVTPGTGMAGGFMVSWDEKIKDTGGAALRVLTNMSVMITVTFMDDVGTLALADCGSDCVGRGWTAHMQGLGLDGEESGFTTTVVPEPVTMVLLATGLVGLGLMRRRRGLDIVTD